MSRFVRSGCRPRSAICLVRPDGTPVGIQASGVAAGAAFFVVASVGKLSVVQIAPRRTQAHFTENALRAAAGVVARDIGVVVQNGGKAGFGDGVAVFLRYADSGGFQVGLPFEGAVRSRVCAAASYFACKPGTEESSNHVSAPGADAPSCISGTTPFLPASAASASGRAMP